ncbi:MAG: DNA repair protein RecO [Candidatus Omnitrophota bacterium]
MICSTPAFVLKSTDIRETSKIAVFFSRDFGKVKGLLKGIRKDPKKFGSTLAPLSQNHIVFYKKRFSEIHLVSQCDLLDDFHLWRGDLKNFALATFVAEFVDDLLPLEDPHPKVFELMFDFLNSLKSHRNDTRRLFEIKLLALSGFKPHFDSCVVCDKTMARHAYFSHRKGGLLCSDCHAQDKTAEPIAQGTVATILYIERSSWSGCLRLNMMPAVRRQLDSILDYFVQFHIGRRSKTDKMFAEILPSRGLI